MLRRLRESMGFNLAEVAQRAGWSPKRQRELETEPASADHDEARVLETLLGVSWDRLDVGGAPLATLLKANADALPADERFALAEACAVAEQLQHIKSRLGEPTGLGRVAQYTDNPDYRHPRYKIAERLAARVRRDLGLDALPGPLSVERDVLAPLGIEVLWQPMGRAFDALAIADEVYGAIIVANPHSEQMKTAAGRRITFAHEVCHILFDRAEMRRFASACAIDGPRGQDQRRFAEIERRARAFAPALLAPRAALKKCWREATMPEPDRIHAVMERFGMSYSATRAHLENMELYAMSEEGPDRRLGLNECWEALDPAPIEDGEHGYLRGLRFKVYVERLYAGGSVSRRWVEDVLRSPLAPPAAWSPALSDGVGYRSSSTARRR